MSYFVSLTRIRENRLKACNAIGTDYSVINDMLGRMLRWSSELDLNANFRPILMPDDSEYDKVANKAAIQVLRELACEHGLNHREAAFMLLDTWSGPTTHIFSNDYRGKACSYPVTINIQNHNWEVISTTVI